MKILFITAWYPNEDNPAAGVFVQEHAKAVSICGDQVVVIYGKRAKIRTKRFYQIFETLEEGIRTIRIHYSPSPFRTVNYLIYLFGILKVCNQVIRAGFRPEIIHAHIYTAGVPAAILGRLFRIPVVLSEHWSGYAQRQLGIAQRIQAKFAMGRAAMILPVSDILKKHIESYDIQEKFQVITNTVDPTLFYPSNENRQGTNPKRILFVGLLTAIKGIPYLLQAAAKLRQQREDWHLDIVGDGPERVEYESLVEDLGLSPKVTFHGLKPKQGVADWMRRADFLVLPSLFETFSVVTAEALTSGIPVLATRCGGPEEFVTKDVGLLVPPRDADALCKGLNDMLDHLEVFIPTEISLYARELFSLKNVGARLHTLYQQLLGLDLKSFSVGYSGERVGISNKWRVLDVGSGHNPHPRADFLLEKELKQHMERSGRPAIRNGRPLILGDAQYLPFKNGSFDYVIASQVAEHIQEPNAFCMEIQRVASRGYIECPGPVGERLLGEPFHLWIVNKKDGRLIFRRKSQNNPLLQLFSDFFYALFYVGQERARRTLKHKFWIQRQILLVLSAFISRIWRSRWLRRWTYTCFKFNNRFDFRVIEE